MYYRTTIVLAAALALCADLRDVNRYRTPLLPDPPDLGSLPTAGPLPEVYLSVPTKLPENTRRCSRNRGWKSCVTWRANSRRCASRFLLGKKGFKIEVGKKIDDGDLRNALRSHGQAANPGDTVQVTGIEFHPKEIVIEINGGGKSHFNIRDHLQIGMGGAEWIRCRSRTRRSGRMAGL